MKRIRYIIIFVSLALMNSCLGVSADIVMRADGSGSVTLEYSVSQMLESLGRQDGNEHWPAIPVGKADFERSVARIPGLRLSSFSVKEYPRRYSKPPSSWGPALGDKDLVTKVKLDFKEPAALLAFLDSTGSRASLVQEGGKNTLRLVLLDPAADTIDADLISLLREISAGYEISLSFTAPKGAALSVIPPSVSAARNVGKKVSFAIGTSELVSLRDGLTLEITW
jgi:hypothetical protein